MAFKSAGSGNAVELQGVPIATTAPSAGEGLIYESGEWGPGAAGGAGVSELTDGSAAASGNVELVGATPALVTKVSTAGANGVLTIGANLNPLAQPAEPYYAGNNAATIADFIFYADNWNGLNGTIWVANAANPLIAGSEPAPPFEWGAVNNAPAGNTAVLGYPCVQKDCLIPVSQLYAKASWIEGGPAYSYPDGLYSGPQGGMDYETAFDMFSSPSATSVGDVQTNHEVMVWTRIAGQTPAGAKIATMTANGISWDVWSNYESAANNGTVSYVAQTPFAQATDFDIVPFWQDAVDRGLVAPDEVVDQICFGWEVCSTNGETVNFSMTNFSMDVRQVSQPFGAGLAQTANFTITPAMNGCEVPVSSASTVLATAPSNTLPTTGFKCWLRQVGAGQVAVVSDGLSQIYSAVGNTTKQQYARVSVTLDGTQNAFYVDENAVTTDPSAPQSLVAEAGNAEVVLGWAAPANNGGLPVTYNVYRGTSSGGESGTPVASGLSTTTYTDTGLSNGTTYYYKVSATNTVGTGPDSNEAHATAGSGSVIAMRGSPVNSTTYVSETNVSLPETTNAGDCIVVDLLGSGGGDMTVSGAGATWVNVIHVTASQYDRWVGYNAEAGATDVTVSSPSGQWASLILSQWSGVLSDASPVVSSNYDATTTTPSASYEVGYLVLAGAWTSANNNPFTWDTTTWSNEETTNSLGAIQTEYQPMLAADYLLPTSGASTTATYNGSGETIAGSAITVLQNA